MNLGKEPFHSIGFCLKGATFDTNYKHRNSKAWPVQLEISSGQLIDLKPIKGKSDRYKLFVVDELPANSTSQDYFRMFEPNSELKINVNSRDLFKPGPLTILESIKLNRTYTYAQMPFEGCAFGHC